MADVPDPRYLKTVDGAYIAYQVVGEGPVDIAWQFDFWGNIDVQWENPVDRYWFESLARMGRLILHDRRATGLSSRNVAAPNLETRAADLRAVLDEVGSTTAVFGGTFESMAPCLLLAASEPERVRALVWLYPVPRTLWSHDFPWGVQPDELDIAIAIDRMQQALDIAVTRVERSWAGLRTFTPDRLASMLMPLAFQKRVCLRTSLA